MEGRTLKPFRYLKAGHGVSATVKVENLVSYGLPRLLSSPYNY